jgi:hypothetical protein
MMKRFKSISVTEDTFDVINNLSKTLLPKVKLSKAQVVENLVGECLEKIKKRDDEIN